MPTPLRVEFQAMASPCEVVVAGLPDPAARALAERVAGEVRRIERKYSRFDPESVIGQINARAGHAPVAIDEETRALFDYAQRVHRLSEGLFDITSGLYQSAWDFKAGKRAATEHLRALRPHVGAALVQVDEGAVRLLDPLTRIDFGGFGKEYAADRAVSLMRFEGATSGYVNLGGDLAVLGPRPDGSPWSMGIRHPRQAGAVLASIALEQGALATSGDYERFFEDEGRRYCHVLNPHTGEPVSHWQSVSVLAPLAVTAGTTATVAMLMESRGLEFLERSGLAFLAVDARGEVHTHESRSGLS